MNKGITICFTHVADVKEIHHNTKLAMSINKINSVYIKMNESVTNKAVTKETLTPIPLKSSFMFHKDFYSKSRITLNK